VKLTDVTIRDFRSLFVDDRDQPFSVHLAEGVNTFVGRNNCGKSNVLRAVSAALDPTYAYERVADTPGPRQFSHPVITLGFNANGGSAEEKALLVLAREYEVDLLPSVTPQADAGRVVLEVSFPPSETGAAVRREAILGTGDARPATPEAREHAATIIRKLRSTVGFVLISSGESLESVLEGNFRAILHGVIRDRLSVDFEQAEQSRRDYITGLQDNLLGPLRKQLEDVLAKLFPEIDGITLAPAVSEIEATLSNVGITIHDLVDTPLTAKGTGVRGGVLVAMFRYLAENATRGMVFALEEPEAFLHPAAQEDLRDNLEFLASSRDVSLLLTTHSPFVVTRSKDGRVFALGKDTAGRTRLSGQCDGHEPHAPLIGDLFREVTFQELIAQATAVPDHAKGVLLVEGDGDEAYLKLAASRAGRPELLADILIRPVGGTTKMATQAVLTRAAIDLPLAVLLDNDEPGKQCRDLLKGKFEMTVKKEIISYKNVFPSNPGDFAYEAEDLFPPSLIEDFIAANGGEQALIDGKRRRPDDAFHYDLNSSCKLSLFEHLERHAKAEHLGQWVELILLIRERLGLPELEAGVSPPVDLTDDEADDFGDGTVLVLTDRLLYPEYLRTGAIVLDAELALPEGITHVAFYVDGAVQPEVPAVVARYGHLQFAAETVMQLRSTGKPVDAAVADLVKITLDADDSTASSSRQVLLLSGANDSGTLVMEQPVVNTKTTSKGKALAWAVGQRVTSYRVLAANPTTTDELEALEQ